jgi:hypothetical protein
MGDHLGLDFREHILDEVRALGKVGLIENPAEIREGDAAVDSSLLLEEVMNHFEKFLPEFNEFIRRIGHDEKLSQVFQIRLDDFGLAIHVAQWSPGGL